MRTPPKRIRKRPRDPVASPARPSMGMALFGREFLDARAGSGAKSVLLVVPRVGSIERLPAGYELGKCDFCEHATRVNSAFVASCKRAGTKLVVNCMSCTESELVEASPA